MQRAEIIRISKVATRSQHVRTAVIDKALIDSKAADARNNDRLREIHNLHYGDEDNLHRMLNTLQPGSYVTPHRHANPPKAEGMLLLRGSLAYVQFDDNGNASEENFVLLNADGGVYGVDIRAGVWHTIFALEPDTVIYEVKPGPYVASNDKGFAPWAPAEGDTGAAEYLMKLEDRFRAAFGLSHRTWKQ